MQENYQALSQALDLPVLEEEIPVNDECPECGKDNVLEITAKGIRCRCCGFEFEI